MRDLAYTSEPYKHIMLELFSDIYKVTIMVRKVITLNEPWLWICQG